MLIPAIDLAIVGVVLFRKALPVSSGSAVSNLFLVINACAGWVAAVSLVGLIGLAVERMENPLIRKAATLSSAVLIVFGAAYCSIFWTFLASLGYGPSGDILAFLVLNNGQLLLHLLQTAPTKMAAFGLFLLVAVFFFTRAYRKFISAAMQSFSIPHVSILSATALAVLVLSAPHVSARISAVSVDKFAIERWTRDARVAEREASLANSLPPRRKYEPTSAIHATVPVIFLLVESLRYDLLEMQPSPIPFLQALSEEAMVFTRSYASSSHSNYADLAVWYSQYPLRSSRLQGYPADAEWRGTSLFEAFKAHDYVTGYISSQNEKWGGMINWLKVPDVDFFYHSEDFSGDTWVNEDDDAGLIRLLKTGRATAGKIEDSKTLRIAADWLSGQRSTDAVFLGVNLQNTHFSYVIPEGGIEPYQPATFEFDAVYYRWPFEKREVVRNRYLNAVRNVDELLRAFVEELKELGIWERCVFVVLGDSGEAFYEHGFGNHSGPMYDEVMRTLTLVKLPGAKNFGDKKIESAISHIDIAPLVLESLGMAIPESFQGEAPLATGESNRPVFMYANAMVRQYGLVSWPWKLLKTEYPYPRLELYHLEADPGEEEDLADREARMAQVLEVRLNQWIENQLAYYGSPRLYEGFQPPRTTEHR